VRVSGVVCVGLNFHNRPSRQKSNNRLQITPPYEITTAQSSLLGHGPVYNAAHAAGSVEHAGVSRQPSLLGSGALEDVAVAGDDAVKVPAGDELCLLLEDFGVLVEQARDHLLVPERARLERAGEEEGVRLGA